MYPLHRRPGETSPISTSPAWTRDGPSTSERSTTPTANPTRSNSPGFITPGCSAISPPSSVAPTWRHPSATPGHQLGHLGGIDRAGRDVVEEEQRLGALAHQVVHAHGHQVDPDGVETAGGLGHQSLGPHSVGAGHQYRLSVLAGVEGEQAAEVTQPAETSARWVDATNGLISSTARSPAPMSTPAPA